MRKGEKTDKTRGRKGVSHQRGGADTEARQEEGYNQTRGRKYSVRNQAPVKGLAKKEGEKNHESTKKKKVFPGGDSKGSQKDPTGFDKEKAASGMANEVNMGTANPTEEKVTEREKGGGVKSKNQKKNLVSESPKSELEANPPRVGNSSPKKTAQLNKKKNAGVMGEGEETKGTERTGWPQASENKEWERKGEHKITASSVEKKKEKREGKKRVSR